MTVDILIAKCHDLGITLAPGPEGKLRVSPPGVLPEELQEGLRRYRNEIMELLSAQPLAPRQELQ